ncbi:MAG: hypothetical protein MUE58_02425 [Chitinophagaceae bacterium]|jgi:hypothetical protein|nr:hypothetical protein [Chitinophagaceae bacterium]
MKSISRLIFTLSLWWLASCGNKESKAYVQENKEFYPVAAHIHTELAVIDSLPVAVFLYRSESGVTDTTIIEKSAFRTLAENIAQPDITREPLKKDYRETVFMDATLNLVTMSYVPVDESAEIRRIDVYIHPETEQVKTVYVEKRVISGDSTTVRKIIWSTGRQLQVTTLISKEGKEDKAIQEVYNWGMQ